MGGAEIHVTHGRTWVCLYNIMRWNLFMTLHSSIYMIPAGSATIRVRLGRSIDIDSTIYGRSGGNIEFIIHRESLLAGRHIIIRRL